MTCRRSKHHSGSSHQQGWRREVGWNWGWRSLRVVQTRSIPALARRAGDHAMTSPTTKRDALQPEAEEAGPLFADWFDPIETALRDRVREFIETMISSELDAALARPRYARRPAGEGGDGVAAEVVGHRHGRRTRTLTGTFGATQVSVPRARIAAEGGGTVEWRSKALRAYQRRTKAAEALIASTYLAGTNTRRAPRGALRRGGRQGRREPHVAQDQDRLGGLERS